MTITDTAVPSPLTLSSGAEYVPTLTPAQINGSPRTDAREQTSRDRFGGAGGHWLYCYPDEAFVEY